MTAITSALSKVNIEEVSYGKSVSEYTNTKIGGSINYLIDNSIEPIGTVIDSVLTETQFQNLKGNKWVLINGQDITGSDLATLTGITTLPAKLNGAASIQSDADGNLGTTSTGQLLAHTHTFLGKVDDDQPPASFFDFFTANEEGGATSGTVKTRTSSSVGGSNNLAAGYKVNKFIKINNDNTP